MDIKLIQDDSVKISVSHETPNITIGRPRSVGISLSPQTLNLKPQKNKGMAFNFVQNVVAGSNVRRLTLAEFEALTSYDGETWYAVTTTADELRYLYLGPTLIAQASQDGTTWGFAYTFPITFGR